MLKFLWNGEMDRGWEDLSQLLRKVSNEFTKTMLETVSYSQNDESKSLITSECMERFKSIVGVLADFISDGGYYQYEDLTSENQNANKLSSWILLGSLTESTMQMFLAFYIQDYKNSKWQQWENFETDKIKKPITDVIQKLIDEKKIVPEQAKKLKKAVKEEIKEHTVEHRIEKIMLDELIQFFSKQELFDEDELDNLKTIQSNRNGIHSFQKRSIGTWADL